MKKIMMLGAGQCQLNALKAINQLGYKSIACDYLLNSPGKKICHTPVLADVFSAVEVLVYARDLKIDGIFTSGTDQPVLTASIVAEQLELPCFLPPEVAYAVTNKKMMKKIFTEHSIPTVSYSVLRENFLEEEVAHLSFPVVVKPIDSQGQRGIFKLEDIESIRSHFKKVTQYSRADEILVESYYKNKELTVSGWVVDGKCSIFTITDRVTFDADVHIGVCVAHENPSIHLKEHRETIITITEQLCKVFKIQNGPIYFQYLVGDEGIKVNEIACRLGGAYEDVSIPYTTGIDLLKMSVLSTIQEDYGQSVLKNYRYDDTKVFSTQLFFCKPGKIKKMTALEELLKMDCVLSAGYNYNVGDTILETENASARAGHIVIVGADETELVKNIEKVYDVLYIKNEIENLVIRGKRYYR